MKYTRGECRPENCEAAGISKIPPMMTVLDVLTCQTPEEIQLDHIRFERQKAPERRSYCVHVQGHLRPSAKHVADVAAYAAGLHSANRRLDVRLTGANHETGHFLMEIEL